MPTPTTPTGAVVETVPLDDWFARHEARAKQTFAVDDLVRLAEEVGTKRERGFVFRVVELKPVGRGATARTDYVIQPVQGGPRTVAQAVHLDPASERDKAIAAATPVATFTPVVGMVVTATRLRGEVDGTRMVVLAVNRDATVRLARLGGDGGRYYPKVGIAALTLAEV